jgi:hypothetical protein
MQSVRFPTKVLVKHSAKLIFAIVKRLVACMFANYNGTLVLDPN